MTPLRAGDPAAVGPHRLLGRLGQGGMGTVYLGVSPDERAVAVKVLREGLLEDGYDARERFRQELAALRRVRGPHLVEVLDADVDAATPYLVTRFVPGVRLDELVARNGPLEPPALAALAAGLADAIATLHAAHVVHRDLTPANVLVLDGHPYLIDLGLAVAADVTAHTRSGLVLGTAGYLAPEQVLGEPVTAAADVHAWGATVAFAATGRPPYGTGGAAAVLYRIAHGEPDLTGVPAPYDALVADAMARDRARRPTGARLVAALGGPSTREPVTVHLPRDVDPTTVLDADALLTQRLDRLLPRAAPAADAATDVPDRELAGVGSGPRPTLAVPPPVHDGWTRVAERPHESRYDDGRYGDGRDDTPPYDGPVPSGPSYDGPDDWPYDDDAGAHDGGPDHGPVWHGDADGHVVDLAGPAPRSRARGLQVAVTSAAALALVGAGALVAPVVAAGAAVVLVVLLRAASRASDRLRLRRQRRGQRRSDPLVALLSSPWHLTWGVLDTVLSLPLLALVAAPFAGAVWLADPVVQGLEREEMTVATGLVVALAAALARRAHRGSRRILRESLLTVTPGAAGAVTVTAVLAGTALLLLAAAEGAAPVWWPLPAPG